MLKKVCTSLWLLCLVSAAFAQEDDQEVKEADESKRPSWSAGMPERQKPAGLKKPAFKPDREKDIEFDMSEYGLQSKPEIEIELPINSGIVGMPVANPKEEAKKSEAEPEIDQAALEQAALEQAALEQAALEQAALEQAALEQAALEQAALEQAALEQAALEQAALEQAALEQAALEQAALEQAALEQAALEQVALEQAALEQAALEQAALEQAALEQAALEQAALEQAALEQAALEQAALEQAAIDQVTASSDDVVAEDSSQAAINLADERSIASVEPPVSNVPTDLTDAAADQVEYNWNILKRTPVDYPIKAAIDNLEGWVEVEITINPAGEVLSASPKDYSRRGRIFGKSAVQSVKDWLFEPPSNLGITTNLTRVYKVEFIL